jgi:hypothetical protein
MDPTSESFEKLREIFHGKKLPTDALESLCGVTPHSCRYCREHFALDFSDQELGAKSIENRKRAELEPSFDNSLGEYKFLNVAYEDLAVGVKMGCPLCAQWSAYITENDITAYKFAPRFRKQWDTYAGFDMCPSLGEEGKLDYGVTVTHGE